MFRTSTTFIKERIPAASVPLLLDFYQQELEYQRVHATIVSEDAVYFRNRRWSLGGTRFGNQYFCFSSGKILIEDTGTEFHVLLEGDLSRILILGGILAGCFGLAAYLASGLNVIAISLGLLVFLLVAVVNYAYTLLFFPVYFTGLRKEMEESLQNLS